MPKRTRISALDAALCVSHSYAIAKGVELPKRAASRSILSADIVFAILLGYAIGKNKLSLIAQDADEPAGLRWRMARIYRLRKAKQRRKRQNNF